MNSNKILSIFFLFSCLQILAQNVDYDEHDGIFKKDTIKTDYSVIDYFRQERDSVVYVNGSVFLMPSDSLSFNGKNEYSIKVSNSKNGSLEIYFKNRLLYQYMLINNRINGTGFCYYPFSSDVALQGSFKEGKLHGLVFVQEGNGEIIEVMQFKNGKYVKHIYHWLSFSKKSLRQRSKGRSINPLRGDETIHV
ncbi:MAG TPA: hypothetical protein DDX39_07870 [Bacteroidales bacterium]|nr:MAG: hypothetical protein A2W98_02375 [Bacteroidetes bacterium GWF2_33_38]OFY76624.1 MAG: hypothetical protein A2265_07170 [Bacteroidetes bacterium RIFOXYA12_FULL_33_9]HBF88543.1 hypothetical protein [Bacteroidales bacterium]